MKMNFRGFTYYPTQESFVPETYTHLIIGTSEGICLASPDLVPRLLPTSHGWPRGPSPRAPSSYRGVSLVDPRSTQAAPHTTGRLGAVWGRAQLHERDPGYTSVAMTHGTHCVSSEAQVVIQTDTLPPQPFV